MKLLTCLFLAISIVAGFAAHKPSTMAMAVEQASQSISGVADTANAEEAGKSVSDADVVDAGHCFTPAIVTNPRDVAAVLIPGMPWTPSDDGVEGREPSNIGRPPNLA